MSLKAKSLVTGGSYMKAADFINTLRPWLDAKLGVSLDLASEPPTPVYSQTTGATPLCAMGLGERGIVTAHPQWVEPLKPIVANLTLDELFSVFGGYELSRVLLPDGFGVWGPSWVYVGDSHCFRPAEDTRPVHLTPEELDDIVDWRIFWHCFEDDAVASFGIFDDDRQLLALASVRAEHDQIWEIGMDVVSGAKGGGLGRAVVSAAGKWILEQGRFVLATTAPWNVPSARTLRSVGLQFIMSVMMSMRAPYRVPPQPLGSPRPDVEIYNYYPDWAINKGILSDEDLT
jgi:RimJ/RimL family protein N-acetyltransferase